MWRVSSGSILLSLSIVLRNSCGSCAPTMDYHVIYVSYCCIIYIGKYSQLSLYNKPQRIRYSGGCITIIKSATSSRKTGPTPQLQVFWIVATALHMTSRIISYSSISTLDTRYKVTTWLRIAIQMKATGPIQLISILYLPINRSEIRQYFGMIFLASLMLSEEIPVLCNDSLQIPLGRNHSHEITAIVDMQIMASKHLSYPLLDITLCESMTMNVAPMRPRFSIVSAAGISWYFCVHYYTTTVLSILAK